MKAPQAPPITCVTKSPEETIALGVRLGQHLHRRRGRSPIVCLFGELGAGKTTLIRGLVRGVSGVDEVSSPTFSYLNIYEGECTVYHFDLYRLDDADAFLSMGFDEFFSAGGICCIEWSERIAMLLPADSITLTLAHDGEGQRLITIAGADLDV